jgi:hypothetical protein
MASGKNEARIPCNDGIHQNSQITERLSVRPRTPYAFNIDNCEDLLGICIEARWRIGVT